MDARKFWTMCRLHDWSYMMSDDPAVYQAGLESLHNLHKTSRGRPDLQKILDAWDAHHFECGAIPPEPKLEI